MLECIWKICWYLRKVGLASCPRHKIAGLPWQSQLGKLQWMLTCPLTANRKKHNKWSWNEGTPVTDWLRHSERSYVFHASWKNTGDSACRTKGRRFFKIKLFELMSNIASTILLLLFQAVASWWQADQCHWAQAAFPQPPCFSKVHEPKPVQPSFKQSLSQPRQHSIQNHPFPSIFPSHLRHSNIWRLLGKTVAFGFLRRLGTGQGGLVRSGPATATLCGCMDAWLDS